MSNMGFILLMSDVDGIVYMILGLFFILTISYGIGCLGRKRKIGFGWAFFISLFLNPLIGLIVVLCSKEKRMDDWQESDSGIDEAVMHREGNIKCGTERILLGRKRLLKLIKYHIQKLMNRYIWSF